MATRISLKKLQKLTKNPSVCIVLENGSVVYKGCTYKNKKAFIESLFIDNVKLGFIESVELLEI
jgi:hypothetical protein